MSIEAKVIADSVGNYGFRITTFQLKFPRFILAEFNTHRALSRNASSSRAIPVKKMLEMVRNDPAMPVYWGKNQPGMQAEEELTGSTRQLAESQWLKALDKALIAADYLDEVVGLHKQLTNRLLELWMHAHVVSTGTEWENFYALRTDKGAQPEFRDLALKMLEAHNASIPVLRGDNNWHLPYVTEEERKTLGEEVAMKVSVARCARVSYVNHDGTRSSPDKDVELHNRLATSGHVSPFEHQARPAQGYPHREKNFRGWIQYRSQLPNENRRFVGLIRKDFTRPSSHENS